MIVTIMVAIVIAAFAHHVLHGTTITFTEALAERPAVVSFDGGVSVRFVVIGISVTVFTEIVPCGFDALMKAALLSIVVSGWRLIPTVLVVILEESRARDWLCLMRAGFECAG